MSILRNFLVILVNSIMKHLIFLWLLLTIAPSWAAKDVPVVELQTNLGKIVLELNPQQAPKTVENFLAYAKSGFYEGTIFHRVIKDFMIQGGGYTKDLTKKSTRPPIPNEANNGLKNRKGTVAMARTGDPNSASSQFFINMADNHFLDHRSPTPEGWGYAVFGQVTQGMEVLNEIQTVKTGAQGPFSQDVPEKTVIIQKVTVTQVAPTNSSETIKKEVSEVVKPRVEDKPKTTLPQETSSMEKIEKEKLEKEVEAVLDEVTTKMATPDEKSLKQGTSSQNLSTEKSSTPSEPVESKAEVTAKTATPDERSSKQGASSQNLSIKEKSFPPSEPVEPKAEVTTKMAAPDGKSPKETVPSQDQSAIMAPDAPSKPDEPELPPS